MSQFPSAFRWTLLIVFITSDVAIASLLSNICELFLSRTRNEHFKYSVFPDQGKSVLFNLPVSRMPSFVNILYLFHPFTILCCGYHSTLVFTQLALLLSLLFSLKGERLLLPYHVCYSFYRFKFPINAIFCDVCVYGFAILLTVPFTVSSYPFRKTKGSAFYFERILFISNRRTWKWRFVGSSSPSFTFQWSIVHSYTYLSFSSET
jgi:hypothetical protein